MSNIEMLVHEAAAMGAAQLAETLGLSSGEISQHKALATYGKWFTDAVNRGRLHPCRVGEGKNGKRSYRITDILELRTADLIRAEIRIRENQTQKS